MSDLLTCAVDTAQTIWCALPTDVSLLVPYRPTFVGTLDLLRLVMVGAVR